MRHALALLALAACGRREAPRPPDPVPVPVPVPVPDAAVSVIRASVAVPVFTAGDRRFLDLSAWVEMPPHVDPAWGAGALTQLELAGDGSARTAKLQPAPAAPAPLRALIGAAVPAYQGDGARCDAHLGDLYLFGYDNGDEMPTSDGTSGGPILVAEVVGKACAPVVVTNRPSPIFFVPEPAAAAKTIVAAFDQLPAVRTFSKAHGRAAPTIQHFHSASGTELALVSREHADPTGCGNTYDAVHALFEVGGAAPVLRGQTDTVFGDAAVLAVLDSDGDGAIEVIHGPAFFDFGMGGTLDLATYLTFGKGHDDTDSVSFDYYIGCD